MPAGFCYGQSWGWGIEGSQAGAMRQRGSLLPHLPPHHISSHSKAQPTAVHCHCQEAQARDRGREPPPTSQASPSLAPPNTPVKEAGESHEAGGLPSPTPAAGSALPCLELGVRVGARERSGLATP